MFKKIIPITVALMLLFSFIPTVSAAETATVVIPVEHKVEGGETDETFSFVIERANDDAPMPENTTLQIKGNGENKYVITYDTAGKFVYRIKEVEGGNSAMKYDERVYSLTVAVTELDGKLTASAILDDGREVKPEKVEFVDYLQESATVSPRVIKKIYKDNEYKDRFDFVLEGEGKKLETYHEGAGVCEFPVLSFDKPGTYKYKISEVEGKKSMWHYDDKVYDYEVVVTKEGDKLTAKANLDEVTFTNKPTMARKVKKVKEIITNTTKTSDTVRYLGIAAVVGLIALAVMAVVKKKK